MLEKGAFMSGNKLLDLSFEFAVAIVHLVDSVTAPKSSYMINQELLCRGWFLQPNTYDCGSFVVNGTAVVGKEPKKAL